MNYVNKILCGNSLDALNMALCSECEPLRNVMKEKQPKNFKDPNQMELV